ncbi:unnamed protein product [Darwinula stevensoni]|uniref:HMG box domain-containing protein n=1 Tax=Darwinula stevensoni TaxID=69355 RepID=A0A7R9A3H4_9CRUS|nr:unnamed protein product [Darwinula stevensoni]CAG0891647.1 unnamed protein product [Darwinula stevensoni]
MEAVAQWVVGKGDSVTPHLKRILIDPSLYTPLLDHNYALPYTCSVLSRPALFGTSHSAAENAFYRRKYDYLLSKCEQIQLDNERLVYRIQQVKKALRQTRKERRFLMQRLDTHGDDYHNVPITYTIEDLPKITLPPVQSVKGKRAKSDLPKRPSNPYLQFCNEKRSEVQEEYLREKGIQPSKQDITRILAHKWNALSQEDKKVYYMKYEQDKERYQAEKQQVQQQLQTAQLQTPELPPPSHPDSQKSALDIAIQSILLD